MTTVTINTYQVGQKVRLSGAFGSEPGGGGTPLDPTAIALKIKLPDGTTQTKTYAAAQVVKDSTGRYHYDFTVTMTGTHSYIYEGTGNVVASDETYFQVSPSAFYT